MKEKKGVSPVIATVLLVGIVIVLGVIIFLWFNSLRGEAITKFDGQNVETLCKNVDMNVRYENGYLYIENAGEVPIFRLNLLLEDSSGNTETKSVSDIDVNWPTYGLNSGARYSSNNDLSADFSGYDSVIAIPVLRGVNEEGKQRNYECKKEEGFRVI